MWLLQMNTRLDSNSKINNTITLQFNYSTTLKAQLNRGSSCQANSLTTRYSQGLLWSFSVVIRSPSFILVHFFRVVLKEENVLIIINGNLNMNLSLLEMVHLSIKDTQFWSPLKQLALVHLWKYLWFAETLSLCPSDWAVEWGGQLEAFHSFIFTSHYDSTLLPYYDYLDCAA